MESESTLCEFFDEPEFRDASPDDILSILEAWESSASAYDHSNKQVEDTSCDNITYGLLLDKDGEDTSESFEFQKSLHIDNAAAFQDQTDETQVLLPKCKKQKVSDAASASASSQVEGGQQRITHITVERNRRKQMNEHLSVLRSLMPCFYVKRGDQASIIGGVVNYINELQQILHSLEAKKQRKSYNEVLSPRLLSSPRLPPLSPRKPPVSPRYSLPLSPSTPQSSSPYKAWMHGLNSPSPLPSPVIEHSPSCNSSSNSINDTVNELVASSKSASAEVEVKFSGSNLVLKTASHRAPGQVVKVVSAIEELDLEILHVSISTVDETMLNSYTIKIGIECQLSAEELAQQIQKTFC